MRRDTLEHILSLRTAGTPTIHLESGDIDFQTATIQCPSGQKEASWLLVTDKFGNDHSIDIGKIISITNPISNGLTIERRSEAAEEMFAPWQKSPENVDSYFKKILHQWDCILLLSDPEKPPESRTAFDSGNSLISTSHDLKEYWSPKKLIVVKVFDDKETPDDSLKILVAHPGCKPVSITWKKRLIKRISPDLLIENMSILNKCFSHGDKHCRSLHGVNPEGDMLLTLSTQKVQKKPKPKKMAMSHPIVETDHIIWKFTQDNGFDPFTLAGSSIVDKSWNEAVVRMCNKLYPTKGIEGARLRLAQFNEWMKDSTSINLSVADMMSFEYTVNMNSISNAPHDDGKTGYNAVMIDKLLNKYKIVEEFRIVQGHGPSMAWKK